MWEKGKGKTRGTRKETQLLCKIAFRAAALLTGCEIDELGIGEGGQLLVCQTDGAKVATGRDEGYDMGGGRLQLCLGLPLVNSRKMRQGCVSYFTQSQHFDTQANKTEDSDIRRCVPVTWRAPNRLLPALNELRTYSETSRPSQLGQFFCRFRQTSSLFYN